MAKRTKQVVARPVPDARSAAREMLRRTVDWMESREGDGALAASTHSLTVDEKAALVEARTKAVEWVRKGAREL